MPPRTPGLQEKPWSVTGLLLGEVCWWAASALRLCLSSWPWGADDREEVAIFLVAAQGPLVSLPD